jgi:uncharacterized protein YdbL (DUF1318 family)
MSGTIGQNVRRAGLTLALAAGALVWAGGASAAAQGRDPAYAAARAAGQVGERFDGYLGVVGNADPAVRRMVEDINIRRRAVYSEKARANNATVEEYAFASGCLAIARTSPGERYLGPDGSWQVRSSGPPRRDSRCP